MRNLVLSGGIRHAFDENTAILVDLLATSEVHCEVTSDISAGIRRLESEPFDMVTVMALRWPMRGDPKYEPYRTEYAYEIPDDCRCILNGFVCNGGGLLGIHTACLCFDDWRGWHDLLGGSWRWGESFHPPPGPVTVEATGVDHVLTADLAPFTLIDEIYSSLDLRDDLTPLLTAKSPGGCSEPVLWAREVGSGRVIFDALGHDHRSLSDSTHARLILRSTAWLGKQTDSTIKQI